MGDGWALARDLKRVCDRHNVKPSDDGGIMGPYVHPALRPVLLLLRSVLDTFDSSTEMMRGHWRRDRACAASWKRLAKKYRHELTRRAG